MSATEQSRWVALLCISVVAACSSIPARQSAESARAYYCNGSKSKRNPTYNINFRMISLTGCDLRSASQGKAYVVENLRGYLQNSLMSDIAIGFDLEKNWNHSSACNPHVPQKSWTRDNICKGLSVDGRTYFRSFMDEIKDERLEAIYQAYDFPPAAAETIDALWQKDAHDYRDPCSYRSQAWNEFVGHSTAVKESAQDDGTIAYTAVLNMDLFCKYAVLKEDMIAR